MLRGVYEENLRIRDRNVPDAPPPAPWWRRTGTVAFLCALVFVMGVVGFSAAGETQPNPGVWAETPSVQVGSSAEVSDVLVRPAAPQPTRMQTLMEHREMSLASLFGLEVKTVVIDPGHGGKDPGGIGSTYGLYESEVVLDVAHMLKERLEARYGLKVLLTRDRDRFIPLRERAAFANGENADLFISLHINKLPVENVSSVETYYFGAGSDERSLQVARAENRGSNYTIAEFREVIEELGNTMRTEESQRLAASTQRNMYRNLRRENPDLQDWGVRTAPFVVLVDVEAPAILVEMGVLSDPADEARLARASYRERLAATLEEGILDYLQPSTQALTQRLPANGRQ